jgi:hypothetical protein
MVTRKELLTGMALAGIAAAAGSRPIRDDVSRTLSFPDLTPPPPNDDANVCRVGVQMHLHPGGAPELYCIRHLRALSKTTWRTMRCWSAAG